MFFRGVYIFLVVQTDACQSHRCFASLLQMPPMHHHLQSGEKLWLNDTKEKKLMDIILLYHYISSFDKENCQNKWEVFTSHHCFLSLYFFFFFLILLVISIQFFFFYSYIIHTFLCSLSNEIKSWVLFWPSFGDLALFIFAFSSSFPLDYTEFPLTFHYKWKWWWVHE